MSLVTSFADELSHSAEYQHVEDAQRTQSVGPPLPVPSLLTEIWLEIFRLHLGPSFLNPRQNSIYAYKHFVFPYGRDAARRYQEKERIRAPLHLVCRA